MIQFCHIAPTSLLKSITPYNDSHLMLAHLVENDDDYREFYRNLEIKEGSEKIMDNSGFEMFKQGKPMYDPTKLIDMGIECKATVIVMSDYPKEDYYKTIKAAKELAPKFKEAGFKTFFVPQSELGDLDGYLTSVFWAIDNPLIDYIGISILGCPIALGIDESKHGSGSRNDAYKLQRYLSRMTILDLIKSKATSEQLEKMNKRFHLLGLVDGPNEISLLKGFKDYIKSWDSSSAVWAGIQNVIYDNSPTGLINGKIESEVDFNWNDFNEDISKCINYNIKFVEKML